MATKAEIMKRLEGDPEDAEYAVAIWCAEDVIALAHQRRIKLTKDEVNQVLRDVDNKWDASIGISWDVLDVYIDKVVGERPMEDEGPS